MNCFGKERIVAIENEMIPVPQIEQTAVETRSRRSDRQESEIAQEVVFTMPRDSTQSCSKNDFKSTLPHNSRQTSIRNLGALPFLAC